VPSVAIGRVALDTSAYSQLRRGHSGILDVVAGAAAVGVPVVAVGEIKAGFRLGSRRRDNEVLLEEFLQEPFVSIIEMTARATDLYAEMFASLRRAGTPIPTNDIWIAALATSAGARLVTFDGDFSRIPDLEHTLLSV
jgi:tRNA(fMet)-specific endonuclease VapC